MSSGAVARSLEGGFSRVALVDRAARFVLLALARELSSVGVTVVDADGMHVAGRGSRRVTVEVRDASFYSEALLRGSVGAARAWARGAWFTDDLVGLLSAFAREGDVLHRFDRWFGRIAAALRSPGEARQNVAAHYDLGDDFFSLFLDDTMTYSSGIFARPDATLRDASTAKIEAIANKLDLRPGRRVLDIGCGWGSFAEFAAVARGCDVTAVTISRAQANFVRAHRSRRIELVEDDYRELRGRWDRIASIEMIEAIGHEQHAVYFRKLFGLLEPGGRAVVQAITIDEARFENHKRTVDFIKLEIFPGSCLITSQSLARHAERAGFRVAETEAIGTHYARTLALWRLRLAEQRSRARQLGYDERFLRSWDWYLAYCEAGFRERYIDCVQVVLVRD